MWPKRKTYKSKVETMLDLTKYKGHTPRPWRWSWLFRQHDNEYEALNKEGNQLPILSLAFSENGTEYTISIPIQADAAIVAAAPDLLAEVEELRAALSDLVKAIEISEGYEREELHTWTAFKTAKQLINGTNNGL